MGGKKERKPQPEEVSPAGGGNPRTEKTSQEKKKEAPTREAMSEVEPMPKKGERKDKPHDGEKRL